MIPLESVVRIRHLFFAEHWKAGTIAAELGVHREVVLRALRSEEFRRPRTRERQTLTGPYLDFLRDMLEKHPRLRSTRLFAMIRERGYGGGVVQLRRVVRKLRPNRREAFLRLAVFPGQEAQADWADFGLVKIGKAQRRLAAFLLTLSWSRALHVEFFFDQKLESFLLGHVHAFEALGGVPRKILVDNLRSAVIERRGDAIHMNPKYLDLLAHYHTSAHPCRPARGNEKGRVERAVGFVRESFFTARPFTTLADFNAQARVWRDEIAYVRASPGGDGRSVAQLLEEERPLLLPLPIHPFETDRVETVRSEKTIDVRFDLNDYSIPPEAVGRDLVLVASIDIVRILDGQVEIARHRRSWDKGELVLDPAHRDALLEQKRRARGSTPNGRLAQAVPEIEVYFEATVQKGHGVAGQTKQLLILLDLYGAEELCHAVREAVSRRSPHHTSVLFLLEQRHRTARRRPPLPVDLGHRPELDDLDVKPHDLETYDDLSNPDSGDE